MKKKEKKNERIVQLFVCRNFFSGQLFVFIVDSNSRIAASRTGATKTRIELISALVYFRNPIDFVKLNYYFKLFFVLGKRKPLRLFHFMFIKKRKFDFVHSSSKDFSTELLNRYFFFPRSQSSL